MKFRDRSNRLELFGILSIILGGLCAILGLAQILLPLARKLFTDSGPPAEDFRSLLMGALTFGIFCAILVWAGIGSLRKRRWVRPVMLVISWTWLLAGIFGLPLVAALLDDLYILASAGMGELPDQTPALFKVIVLAATAVGGILLPALFVLAYRDREIMDTCRLHDPDPAWTERCPPQPLGLSVGLGLVAILALPLALKPAVPLFGAMITGWGGSILTLAGAALCGYLARETFRLSIVAWWITSLLLLLLGVSTVVTIRRAGMGALYGVMGYPKEEIAAVGHSGSAGELAIIWIMLAATLLSLVYMVAIRKHFRSPGGRLLLLLLLSGTLLSCAVHREPVLEPLRDSPERNPVVLIPGITGSQLREASSGRVLWGRGRNLLFPRDGGAEVALPFDPAERLAQGLEPFAPVMHIKLFGFYKKEIYAPIARLMEKNGYLLGDDFLIFNYDWRYGAVRAAHELLARLEELRLARGESKLRVTLICQSNAALIGRYLAKYGGATIPEAESGLSGLPPTIEVDKIILIGTSNGGSMRVLRELLRGRRYVRWIGRRILPETLFSFESLLESLPVYRKDLFFDGEGRSLDVDLFDADNWMKYGWSSHSDGAPAELYLREMLDRTQRLQRLLVTDPAGFVPPRYYSVQNSYRESPERAMLVRGEDGWMTYFEDDEAVRRDPYLLSLAASPGDGHATVESQNWLSPMENRALAHPPFYIEGGHFEIILSPATMRRTLQFLAE